MARQIRDDRHNDKLSVRLHLVSAGVIEQNLIPILLASPDDDKMWQVCLQWVINPFIFLFSSFILL